MDFMLGNPVVPMGRVALEFGVTQAWLSTIIHSDAFQNQLREKSQGLYESTVLPLREQVMGVARVAIDKLGEALENASAVSDKPFIASAADNILKNLGYGPKSTPSHPSPTNIQNNYLIADKSDLASAREKMNLVHKTQEDDSGQTFTAEAIQPSRTD